MTREKLDKETMLRLLRKADSKWFATHSGQFNYQEHLEFISDYIAKHYRAPVQNMVTKSAGKGAATPQGEKQREEPWLV